MSSEPNLPTTNEATYPLFSGVSKCFDVKFHNIQSRENQKNLQLVSPLIISIILQYERTISDQ